MPVLGYWSALEVKRNCFQVCVIKDHVRIDNDIGSPVFCIWLFLAARI